MYKNQREMQEKTTGKNSKKMKKKKLFTTITPRIPIVLLQVKAELKHITQKNKH